jgi:muramidase (phage lysozyme)
MATREELEAALENPNVQTYLKGIRDAEGTSKHRDPYRVAGGGKVVLPNLDKYDPVSWGFTQTDGKKNRSTAAGAYQFLNDTWGGVSRQYGLSDFSPRSQDIGALALMAQNGSLHDVLAGDFDSASKKDASTWASFPDSPYSQAKRSKSFMNRAWGREPSSVDPTPPTVKLARDAVSKPQKTMLADMGPSVTSDQRKMLSKIIQESPTDQHDMLANVAMRLPQLEVPDLFGAGLPNVLDDKLMNLIETA